MTDSLMHLSTVYGPLAKIGVIVPPTNTANEAEWKIMSPDGVSIHAARMPLHTDTASPAGLVALMHDVEKHALDLAAASVDLIVYGCTAGSMVSPVTAVADFIQEKTGIAGLTTAQAIVDALQMLRVKSLAVVTPYHDAMNEHERSFLHEHGVQVVSIAGLGYGKGGNDEFRNIARVAPATVLDLARKTDRKDADAVLISCTDLATLPVLSQLEAELNKPVISSNTATFWRALRLTGVDMPITGFGRLFEFEA